MVCRTPRPKANGLRGAMNFRTMRLGGSPSSVTHPCDHRGDIDGERERHGGRDDQHEDRVRHRAGPRAEGRRTRAGAVVTLALEQVRHCAKKPLWMYSAAIAGETHLIHPIHEVAALRREGDPFRW